MQKTPSVCEVLYPSSCAACGKIINSGEVFCDYCYEMLLPIDPLKRCYSCGVDKKYCDCKRHTYSFNACVAPFVNRGPVRRAMHSFKFRGKTAFGSFAAGKMAFCVKNEYRSIDFDGVCFVPMAKRKLLKREQNQSEFLARRIAEYLNLPIYNILSAKYSPRSQHTLTEKQRFRNVKGLYSAKYRINGARLLLVDDIKTTGATLDECTKQLLSAGAKEVYCVTALIGQRKKRKKEK